MMYFDVKATNLQEVLEVLPVCHDATGNAIKALKIRSIGMYSSQLQHVTYRVIFFKLVNNTFNMHVRYHLFIFFGECNIHTGIRPQRTTLSSITKHLFREKIPFFVFWVTTLLSNIYWCTIPKLWSDSLVGCQG